MKHCSIVCEIKPGSFACLVGGAAYKKFGIGRKIPEFPFAYIQLSVTICDGDGTCYSHTTSTYVRFPWPPHFV